VKQLLEQEKNVEEDLVLSMSSEKRLNVATSGEGSCFNEILQRHVN